MRYSKKISKTIAISLMVFQTMGNYPVYAEIIEGGGNNCSTRK